MADKTYRVKGLMAIVNLDNGSAVHLQHGAPLPPNVDPAHLRHLLDNDLVEQAEPVGGLEPVFTGDRTEQVTFSSEEEAKAADKASDTASDEGAAPAKSASKADWVDYAVAQGADRDEADASTKDDLIATYGGA